MSARAAKVTEAESVEVARPSVLRLTLVVRHPETDVPTALIAGDTLPDWAVGMVHEDDLAEPPEEAETEAEGTDPEAESAES